MTKNKILLYLFIATITLSSCSISETINDRDIATDICEEVGAESGKISYTKTTNYNTDKESTIQTITLNIDSSFMVKKGWDKRLVASYCAAQLNKRLDEGSLSKIEGFHIMFDNVTLPEEGNIFYFSKQDINDAEKAITIIDSAIKEMYLISNGYSLSYYDTSLFHLNNSDLDQFAVHLKDSVSNLSSVKYFYTLVKYSNDKYYFEVKALLQGIDGHMSVANFVSKAYEDFKIVK